MIYRLQSQCLCVFFSWTTEAKELNVTKLHWKFPGWPCRAKGSKDMLLELRDLKVEIWFQDSETPRLRETLISFDINFKTALVTICDNMFEYVRQFWCSIRSTWDFCLKVSCLKSKQLCRAQNTTLDGSGANSQHLGFQKSPFVKLKPPMMSQVFIESCERCGNHILCFEGDCGVWKACSKTLRSLLSWLPPTHEERLPILPSVV